MAVPRGGQEPLPLKVAPIQPSVTAAFNLQSRRESDCQMWKFGAGVSAITEVENGDTNGLDKWAVNEARLIARLLLNAMDVKLTPLP